jgi:eukaryotic-like serine/threonine-protein kinase
MSSNCSRDDWLGAIMHASVGLATGTKLGPYEIQSLLGAGGMGEVYRARDTKLGRDVALKVLPEAFAKDADRMARFKREAQVLASLNHPNIATIYGLEESGGARALVMELVEGPTLAERLKSGAIPLEGALPIAKQVADALEAAHERGIIHRDLKPANIKVTPEGAVKVLDFGLAKALDVAVMSSSPTATPPQDSPTLSMAATQAGVILGTAAYMSPEQARGKGADRRADIWAFGCVLFEILTGVRAFEGETVSDTLAAVLKSEADWSALPAEAPPRIRDLVRRCLNKDPRQRLQAIGDARIAIEETLSGTDTRPPLSPLLTEEGKREARGGDPWRRAIPWSLAALAVLSLGVALWSLMRAPRPPTRPVARLVVALPPTEQLALGPHPAIALSPDGSRLVYVARHGGGTHLYTRPIARFEAALMPGTEGAESPFFSPDGQSVGFFADGKLKRVSVSGGAPLTLCSAPTNRGGSWAPDDTIIFAPAITLGLFEVPAAGGTPKPLTVPDRKKGEYGHRWPQILPGGKAVLFTIWTGAYFDEARIGVLSLETGERRVLIEGGTYARYIPSGHMVYARAGGLLAVPFDLKRLEVTGPSVSILEGVSMNPTFGGAEFSSSSDGSLVYVPGGSSAVERTLLWVDRKGEARPLPAPPRAYLSPRLSPDGQRLAVSIEGTNAGLWLYDLARGTLTRLTETAGAIPFPIWTPDGKRVTFLSALGGALNLYWMPADGSGAAERLTTSENTQWPGSWSPNGLVLAFSESDPTTGSDIWVLRLADDPSTPLGAGRKAQPFLQTPSNESGGIFSPDGRWLAYVSDESGRQEVYLRPFPGPGGRLQISTEGGIEPVWARNGRELFYRNGDKMMVVAVETKGEFAAAKPKVLFEAHYETSVFTFEPNYDVIPDAQSFIMIKGSEQESAPTQVNVVLNWFEELKRLAPEGKR